MLELNQIPFFSSLPSAILHRIERAMDLCAVPPRTIVCRKGEQGRFFYAIASGGVNIDLMSGLRNSSVYLGAGQVFGEMSLFTDSPVSATVKAVSETHLFRLSKNEFLKFVDSEPEIYRALIEILVDRLRHRSEKMISAGRASCCFVVSAGAADSHLGMLSALFDNILHYSPGSILIDCTHYVFHGGRRDDDNLPEFFPEIEQDVHCCIVGQVSDSRYSVDAPLDWLRILTKNWKSAGSAGQVLLIAIDISLFQKLLPDIEHQDIVVGLSTNPSEERAAIEIASNFAENSAFTLAIIAAKEYHRRSGPGMRWGFQLSNDSSNSLDNAESWNEDPKRKADVDWLARWVTKREIGLALSAGAARGFAHLGVIDVLERAGIPIDCVSGTSMGGIVALVYGMTGNAEQSITIIRDCLGKNSKLRDRSLIPRGSYFKGKKISRAAHVLFGDLEIGALQKPCAVVAADLVRGERLVMDKGLVAIAALGTSAIPGLFPPIEYDGRILTDGALMSRIPLDVLDARRCGLRLAVNVVPSPEARKQEAANTLAWLKDRTARLLGLRSIIGYAWELQAWTHGANEAESADLLIEPDTKIYSGFDFDRFDEMVDAGRSAADAQLDLINASVDALLRPGVP